MQRLNLEPLPVGFQIPPNHTACDVCRSSNADAQTVIQQLGDEPIRMAGGERFPAPCSSLQTEVVGAVPQSGDIQTAAQQIVRRLSLFGGQRRSCWTGSRLLNNTVSCLRSCVAAILSGPPLTIPTRRVGTGTASLRETTAVRRPMQPAVLLTMRQHVQELRRR